MDVVKIYEDTDFDAAVVPQGTILIFNAFVDGQLVARYKDSNGNFGTLSGSSSGGSSVKPAYATAEPVGNTVTAQAVTPSADGSSSTNDGQPVTVLWNFELPVQSTETEQEV